MPDLPISKVFPCRPILEPRRRSGPFDRNHNSDVADIVIRRLLCENQAHYKRGFRLHPCVADAAILVGFSATPRYTVIEAQSAV
jgi:hypothetical protein